MRGNVWHLDCCNPENNFDSDGWTMFNAIFGWTNSATIGTVLGYVFYWLAAIVCLIIMKYIEVRPRSRVPTFFFLAWISVLLNWTCLSYFVLSFQGRTKLFGKESVAGTRRRERAALRRGDSELSAAAESDPK